MIYKFTVEERRALLRARQQYLSALNLIAEIHGLEGNIGPDEQLTGFVDLSTPTGPAGAAKGKV